MNRNRILVADSGEYVRMQIVDLLTKRGYGTYQATDGAGAIRIARNVQPDLTLIDLHLWGHRAYEVAEIIEQDRLSTVVLMTNSPNQVFYEKLKQLNLFAYITKPIQAEQLYYTVEFALINSDKINSLIKKVERLENTLEGRKKVERAKGILMKRFGIVEEEAYQILRKRSMDRCLSIDKVAEEVIAKEREA